ncbi:N-acylglucosamine 2-epimerase [Pullulanibacillus pueri]|uniref:N-acylglucosamine 2-epimerase n=1 Tax=Pullulanibacillus pueri TaxID=1437324 RepID=A0A8J2ZYP6_9BACL|nr:AGE family epimerase/isomerase [Pullulanibacillus pueri]MBM7683335.1 N-acylglucosamine 2-epimerase [Pullulanibacillus pueri]GGH86361.1 N-acylglucosamine 2-epimerase [Pullulanibacillus pueri]
MALQSKELLNFYKNHLETHLLPFWQHAIDQEYGGIYTCFNNSGDTLVSHDKYTWSQGRFIWLWSKLAELCQKGILEGDPSPYLDQARLTIEFLWNHAILPNGHCAFLLTRNGELKESLPGNGFDTSFYADCFVILGLSRFASVTEEIQVVDRALTLYDRLTERLKKGDLRSEPYPIPEGLKAHSVPMILLNITTELYECLKSFKHDRVQEFKVNVEAFVEEILTIHREKTGLVTEMVHEDRSRPNTELLCRHINPGHTIEDMWFIIQAGRTTHHLEWISPAVESIAVALEVGWDQDYGGLLRFVDREGGKPSGSLIKEPYETLILETWDTKLWWPHSEALYATLLAEQITHEERIRQWYQKFHDYVFHTFPNPDSAIGEWIQIRDRLGQPIDKVVALPVKDPFHIIRNVLLIIELLEDKDSSV